MTQELPRITFTQAELGSLDAALAREWLVTNGAGGYAMGSVAGATTRVYHAYLIAAPRAPQERVALVTQLAETATLSGSQPVALAVCESADGSFAPNGYSALTRFALDGLIPTFTYQVAPGCFLEKRIWMEHGANVTYVSYTYHADGLSGATPLTLSIEPYCVCRDHHSSQHGNDGWRFAVTPLTLNGAATPNGCLVRANPDATPLCMLSGAAAFAEGGRWRWQVEHRAERERGLDDHEDVYIPGAFTAALVPGAAFSLILSASEQAPTLPDGATPGATNHEAVAQAALERELTRQHALLAQAGNPADALTQRLTLAADQFVVGRRPAPISVSGAAPAVTVIAGYPWFTDWGRDTMISLPGLLLETGRYAEAKGLLRGFVGYMSQGMIPNRFPDRADAPPEYNTVDATLWLFHALDRYLSATSDWRLLAELFPALDSVINWHVRGTRYGIQLDAADGLLRSGADGLQLTWMDAKVSDWVVTPRRGKPVEISALWYHALRLMSGWSRQLGKREGVAQVYDGLAALTRATFAKRYWYPAGGYFADVVDVNGQSGALDTALRPNQVIALAVAPELVSAEQGRAALAAVERTLLTPLGLRTLAPDDPHYQGYYGGDQRSRDGAYHQGTVWPWLLGSYADACRHFEGDEEANATRQALLTPLTAHLREAGIGSISEIATGDAPFSPVGCPAQAWSVAEALRACSPLA